MKIIHKFYRSLKTGDQFKLCSRKKCNNAEDVSYFWHALLKPASGTKGCKKCIELRVTRRAR